MGVPLFQAYKVGRYIASQKLRGVKRYPLVLMLEPLFRCNLACAGCGKIDYPDAILNQRLSVDECVAAADECGAPMVVIAGGEPLLHREIDEIARRIRTGTISVNGGQWFGPDSPFGGYKESGQGREHGVAGFEEYLETKTVGLPAK